MIFAAQQIFARRAIFHFRTIFAAQQMSLPNSGVDSERDLVDGLLTALSRVPELEVREARVEDSGRNDRRADAALLLSLVDREIRVIVQCKRRSLYPRDAREVLHQLRAYRSAASGSQGPEAALLVAADAISQGARAFLRAEGAGYFQAGGTLFLSLPGLLVDVERPPAKSSRRVIKSLFGGTRAKVIHALLSSRDRLWGTTALAEAAQVSPGTASQVLNELEQQEWVEVHGRGPRKARRIVDPGRLLDEWAKQAGAESPPPLHRYYVPGRDDNVLLRDVTAAFEEAGAEYAFTHEAAGNQYNPFLTHVAQLRARVRPGPAVERALAALKARKVTEGANLALVDDTDGAGLLFREKPAGTWLASPYQTYIDLVRSGGQGRAKELAEHLRRETIRI